MHKIPLPLDLQQISLRSVLSHIQMQLISGQGDSPWLAQTGGDGGLLPSCGIDLQRQRVDSGDVGMPQERVPSPLLFHRALCAPSALPSAVALNPPL